MSAIFSPCRQYRYVLTREWPAPTAELLYTEDPHLAYYPGQHDQTVMFIGLNPSTADEVKDDPTIRKCIEFAKRWGFGRLWMGNLFAFRATDPRVMKGASKPIGPDNDMWLAQMARSADLVVAAWGCHGQFMARDEEVLKLLDEVHCLRKTKEGHPEHPLYIPYSTQPIPYQP